MFIEFLDQLRCIVPHEDSWLVASFTEQRDRFIVRGTLGCPICFREYPIQNGAAYFGVAPESVAPESVAPESVAYGDASAAPDPDAAMRAAAFLNARERCTLVLAGVWAASAHAVTELMPMRIFALNPASRMDDSEMVAILYAKDAMPVTPSSIDGIALDRTTATDATVHAALSALRPGGRLVAPVTTPVPDGVTELARDEHYWVGETTPALVMLHRR
jgi:hypothetical protein